MVIKKIDDYNRSNEEENFKKFEKSTKTFEKDIEEAIKIEKANHDKIMLKLEQQSKHLVEKKEINRKEISGTAFQKDLNSLFINSDPNKILFHFFWFPVEANSARSSENYNLIKNLKTFMEEGRSLN